MAFADYKLCEFIPLDSPVWILAHGAIRAAEEF